MKILIIGSGIAGVIAQRYLSNHDVEVFDKGTGADAFKNHYALLRMRDKTLAQLIGVTLEEITVYKSYALNGSLFTKQNITANNLYSIKTHNSIEERSLKDCGIFKRYLFNGKVQAQNVNSNVELIKIIEGISGKNVAIFRTNQEEKLLIEYDYLISTIPMPIILKAANIKHNIKFNSEMINIYIAKLNIYSTVHQTIYFPESEDLPYRITIQNKKIIVESIDEIDEMYEVEEIIHKYFGINYAMYSEWTQVTQVGKLRPIDSNKRKALMVELNKLNIYSLGRNAIWKSIRADHLIGDIEKIKHFIEVSEEHRNYENNINSDYPKCSRDDNTITVDPLA